ncbi:MAG: toll/interleukin-1 receptor domain-containing protein [Vicinamibacterales bacterium]
MAVPIGLTAFLVACREGKAPAPEVPPSFIMARRSMADVFVSYPRDDEPKARQLAETLTAHGWDVWWDRHIPPGHDFSEFIQHQHDHAACVVVLWSRASIASEYVRDEATEAKEPNALVPALIEDVRPPLGFRQRQVANLSRWSGDVGDPDYLLLIGAIARLVPRPVNAGASAENPPPPFAPEQPGESPHAEIPMTGAVAAVRRLSRRSTILAAAAIVLALAGTGLWYLDVWSSTPRSSYRQLDVNVRLGDWMRVRALYGTAAFYRAVEPKIVIGRLFAPKEMWSSPSIRGVVALPRRWDSIEILFPHKASQAPVF